MEFEEKLLKAKNHIKRVDKIRVGCLMFAVVVAAFLYFGNNYVKEASWYIAIFPFAVKAATILVCIALLTTLIKFPLIRKHNRILKEYKGL